ncbi:MAG TPA: 2OG-Fe(II) oxygenase [Acidiferrobacterales bacterium]|jgi:SM-20-related protein
MLERTPDPPIGSPPPARAEPLHADALDPFIDTLAAQGHAWIENFLPAPATQALLTDLQRQYARGLSRPAGVGRGAARQLRTDIRGDHIVWWDPRALSAAQSIYWRALTALGGRLNRELYLGLHEIECHYAHYPPGGGYARHRDAFRGDTKRLISCVFYLNPRWRPGDGGELRLFVPTGPDERRIDIPPRAGTLAVFLSQSREHAVMPAVRDRFSIAAWMRRV